MPKLNKSKYAVLGFLRFQPMSGYDIKKYIDSSIAFFWNENYGQLYPVLKQLEKEELVSKVTKKTEGKPDSYIYTITEQGKKEFTQWLSQPSEPNRFRIEFLLKFFFGQFAPIEDVIVHLKSELQHCREMLKRFDELEKDIDCCHKQGENESLFGSLALKYGQSHYAAEEKWCEQAISLLESKKS